MSSSKSQWYDHASLPKMKVSRKLPALILTSSDLESTCIEYKDQGVRSRRHHFRLYNYYPSHTRPQGHGHV